MQRKPTSGAFDHLIQQIQEVPQDQVAYVHLSMVVYSPEDPREYTTQSLTLYADNLTQHKLAEYQRGIIPTLWENAHKMRRATPEKGSIPVWSQPPRWMWALKWYDWLLAGATIGTGIGMMLRN